MKKKSDQDILYGIGDPVKGVSLQTMREFFFLDGSEVIYCKKDYGDCKAGNYYLVSNGKAYGWDYVVHDWHAFSSWPGREYMRELANQ